MQRLLFVLAFPATLSAQTVSRIVVTPAPASLTAGDTLRLKAQAIDAAGRPVPGATIRFQQVGGQFEGIVTPDGHVTSGAVGTLPVVVSAVVGNEKPVIAQVEVRALPGPAASVHLAPVVTKLLVGQSVTMKPRVLSKAGDLRPDAVAWASSSPSVARVAADGSIVGVAAGRALITAKAGSATTTISIQVIPASVGTLSLTPASPQARTGDVVRFHLSARDANGAAIDGLTPTWLLAPGDGAIDAGGAFVGYVAGTYTVTAMLGQRTAQATVTLTARDVRRPAKLLGSVVRNTFATSEVWVHPTAPIAYLGTHLGGDRVYILDVSNPGAPAVIDSLMVNARVINDVMTSEDGKVLVVTREGADDRKNGIVIYDSSDPRKPRKVSEFTEGVTAGVHSAYVYTQPRFGRHIYLTNDGTGALHIIDINDPAKPREVAVWKTPRTDAGRSLHDIDVRDGMLYASYWNDGLVILDIGKGTNGGSPSNPTVVSQFKYDLGTLYKQVEATDGPGFIRGTHTAWRHKNYVFIADEVFSQSEIQKLMGKAPARAFGRLQVVDISDPSNPKSVAYYEPEYGGVHNIWIAGDTLYMGAYNAGFRAFDISGELRGDLRAQQREIADFMPSDPKGFIPNTTMTWGVVVKDGIAYINDFNTGLSLVKIVPKSAIVP
ncbi:MAG: Ig-like domain-containing protein [Gemmatimonadota bacterium]|nr:Ig-like domain-containing protein [Gemmatimonadota bacterium]